MYAWYVKIGEQSLGEDARGGVPVIDRNICLGAVAIGQPIPEYALVIRNPDAAALKNYQRSDYYYPKEDECE